MKLKNYFWLCAAASVPLFTMCSENEEATVTKQITKIETSYKEGDLKFEGITGGPKIETQAPQEFIEATAEKIDAEIEELMRTRTSGRTSAVTDYDIGVPTSYDGTCYVGEKIEIFMDCEDSSPETKAIWVGKYGGEMDISGTGTGWTITTNKNIQMYYCRQSAQYYNATDPSRARARHAVLRLGSLVPPGVSKRLLRYFDNEDSGNDNFHVGDIAPNTQGTNTSLTFYVYPAQAKSFNMGIGVLAIADPEGYYKVWGGDLEVVNGVKYYIDDEDSNNNDYWKINGSTSSGSGESFLYGDHNTSFWLTTIVQ